MKTCEHCHKEYDETNINIPNPLPDYMCAHCGKVGETNAMMRWHLDNCKNLKQ